ncbi:MAG: tRNA (cytidine(56)-2'-O)-methyltransferase [Candidatus Diapherotrites archaeon]|nr:tRNA (cytidine(56)-2'-O)-methyltransferase [Candidatus Diapherotrites archaeon]
MEIVVLRYGHRHVRDYRVTTHCGLVSRALGAKKIIICGEQDLKIIENINKIKKNWGGDFELEFAESWKKTLKEYKKQGFTILHNTMYGIPLQKKIKEIRKAKKILIVIGSKKVETEVYHLSDYNIAVTNQPHSEIASLAITLDLLQDRKELEKEFSNSKIKIIPSENGKHVENSK